MTYIQYREILSAINKRLSWDIQLNTLSVTGEFNNELSPLFSQEIEDKVFKLSDAMALKNMANG
ncbi:hypothetical protein PV797_04905 [Clostridiaceae bacterium M8S5]|nr:hypothetical protein PV797_04905 [Clostridiaceae bacterium M8S5]